jgi:predicted deacylase
MARIEAATIEARLKNKYGFHVIRGQDTPGGEGPYNMITAGIHGDEEPGIKAARRLLPYMRQHLENGTIIFGWGNLEAIADGERGDPNLNRLFQKATLLSPNASTTHQRAAELMIPLEEGTPVEALLDMHGTSNPVTTPHIITEPQGYDLASQLPADVVVSGFDKFEPGGIDHFANTQGKIGICVEPGYNKDPKAIKRAYQTALAFLVAQGHISGETARRIQKHWRLFYVYKTKEHYIPQQPTLPDFTPVEQGQLLGHDGDQEVRVPAGSNQPNEAIVLFGAKERAPGAEAFLLAQNEEILPAEPTATLK